MHFMRSKKIANKKQKLSSKDSYSTLEQQKTRENAIAHGNAIPSLLHFVE